ncbi:MAG: Hsp20/alpha crystallin family protein [Nitrososphaeria archaeon]
MIDNVEPLSEIYETSDSYIITMDLPFVTDKNQIEIYAKENELEIIATMNRKVYWSSFEGFGRKVEVNKFRKKISLPVKIDPETVKATFKNGVLIVEIPKKREKKTKINIS